MSCIGYITSSTGKQLAQADTYARELPGRAHNAYGRVRVWVQLRSGEGDLVTERICEVTGQFDTPSSDPYWAHCGLSADTNPTGRYTIGLARFASPNGRPTRATSRRARRSRAAGPRASPSPGRRWASAPSG